MNGNIVRLLLVGPLALVLLAAALAVIVLLAAGFGRLPQLTALGTRAVGGLSQRRFLLTGWGVAALLLTLLLGGLLLNTKPLALLGIVILLTGSGITALGMSVSAVRFGQSLAAASGSVGGTPWQDFKAGLSVLFFATFLPFVGWLAVVLAVAAGLGAMLQAIFHRDV